MPLLDSLVHRAHQMGASDLHLEPGLPAAVRTSGRLRTLGDPIRGADLLAEAQRLLRGEPWTQFATRRSADLSRTIRGVRCRINVLHSSRGVGFAIRLLSTFQATLDSLNLHPDLAEVAHQPHGLVLISGPTGSGKSSTVAGLIHEINRKDSRHIVTLEQPIEHLHRPRKSFIRQREVGRDTPSFDQGILDALREDPDVIVVGEMRRPETIRLTLNAAETGHLVFATLHSGSVSEAIARVVTAFAPEAQAGICAMLADCLVAVVCQRLVNRRALGIRVPELQILRGSDPARNVIRNNQLHKIQSVVQTGAADGSWSWDRYRRWLDSRTRFFTGHGPGAEAHPEDVERAAGAPQVQQEAPRARALPSAPRRSAADDGVVVLDGQGGDLESILSEL